PMAKNTICLWYDKDAEAAARFYAKTFPDSSVGAIQRAPSDNPSGKEGDVLVVEFTVAGIPCIGLNGGPTFKHSEAFSFQIATEDQDRPLLGRNRRQWRTGERMRLVQGQVGPLLADHATHADRGDGGRRRGSQARLRRNDENEEDRRRHDRGGAAGRAVMSTAPAGTIRDDELLIERTFEAPLALVWRLWESRDHMIRWWGPEAFTCLELDWELKPGRQWRAMMASKQYERRVSRMGGTIREVERHKRIAFTFAWDEDS